jgi:hypothetical protein
MTPLTMDPVVTRRIRKAWQSLSPAHQAQSHHRNRDLVVRGFSAAGSDDPLLNIQHEWSTCEGFRLDASPWPKLPSDKTEERNVRLATRNGSVSSFRSGVIK